MTPINAVAADCGTRSSGIRQARRRPVNSAAISRTTHTVKTAHAMNPITTSSPRKTPPVSRLVNPSHTSPKDGTPAGSSPRPNTHNAIGAPTTTATSTINAATARSNRPTIFIALISLLPVDQVGGAMTRHRHRLDPDHGQHLRRLGDGDLDDDLLIGDRRGPRNPMRGKVVLHGRVNS